MTASQGMHMESVLHWF